MRNFNANEFACNDGCGDGFNKMSAGLLTGLDLARDKAGIPFLITSAYRCPKHNKAVGGVEDSAHTTGHAVDISAHQGREKWMIVRALMTAGFTRIGVAKNFIHVDNDPHKPANVLWVY